MASDNKVSAAARLEKCKQRKKKTHAFSKLSDCSFKGLF